MCRCPFSDDGGFLSQLKRLHAGLPRVLSLLRYAQTGLQAVCAVPSRSNYQTASQNWQQALLMRKSKLKRQGKYELAMPEVHRTDFIVNGFGMYKPVGSA